ncbi:nucleotide sugar dehydrogenase [Nocardioides sp. GCM10027113]|uniref:nucleotide sugar dehydrogenase n=1 Tax=unclassified Nocardioides TaxID=2615069 RepID=UPI00361E40FE
MVDFAVVGLGYVGLPLARAAVAAGLSGVGIDASPRVVDLLAEGRSHVDDLSDQDVSRMLAAGFLCTTDESVLHDADVIVICVPTPLGQEGGPDLGAVRSAAESVARQLQPGALVILESTTWPGTTDDVLRPILETTGLKAGVDFHLAYSPERIDPGNPTYGIENTPKIVGGLTDECRDRALAFYATFIDTVVPAKGTREAEMAKLLENTYRQVNIALVNEMARFSHALDIDIWDVIRCASSKPFGFQPFYPGPGVGGHCIPIDPSYLSHHVQARLGYPFRFVELAQEINRSMPGYVVQRAVHMLNEQSMPVRGSKVLLLGVTYKPGIADQRESPAQPLGVELLKLGADLRYFDAFVDVWELGQVSLKSEPDVEAALHEADLVIHLQPHSSYGDDVMASIATPVLDTRGILTGEHVSAL